MAIDIYESLYRHNKARHTQAKVRKGHQATVGQLAYLADKNGVVKIAYDALADIVGCCRRTAIRHIKYLVEEAKILIKYPLKWLDTKRCDWNVYRFRIPFKINSAHPFMGDTFAKMSPTPKTKEEEREKELRLVRENIAKLEKGLRFYDNAHSVGRQSSEEALAHAKAQLAALESHHA